MKGRKIVSILLIVSMVLVLFGCGNFGVSDKQKFVGNWKATVDMTDVFNESFLQGLAGSDEDLAEYFDFGGFELVFLLTFNDNGTYTMEVDEDSFNDCIGNAKEIVKNGLASYFEEMIAGLGLEMSADELLGNSGISIDALFDEYLPDDLLEELETTGNWKAENGKLYTTESLDDDIDEDSYELYEFTSEGIRLSKPEGAEDELGIFPLVLTKVK